MKHVSYKGQHVDMELLRFKNQHQVALGNANLNARGDLLGRGGVIVKTREELLKETEIELTKPDYDPNAQYAQKQEKLPDLIRKDVMDFASDDSEFEVPEFKEEPEVQEPVQEEKVQKRAPRKSST